MESNLSLESPMDEGLVFSNAIPVETMEALYNDIKLARCKCGGAVFPNGPVGLSPENTPEHLMYKLMFVYCPECESETRRLYVIDTTTKAFKKEQRHAYSQAPIWGRINAGNPIETDIYL